jgi:hypothetical protein
MSMRSIHAVGIDIDYAMIQKNYAGGIAGERTPQAHLDQLRGTRQSDHANAHATVHAPHQRILKEGGESRAHGGALHGVLQLTKIHKTLRVTPAMAAGLAATRKPERKSLSLNATAPRELYFSRTRVPLIF